MRRIKKFILTLPILFGVCLSGNAMRSQQGQDDIPKSDQTIEQEKSNKSNKDLITSYNKQQKYENAVKKLDTNPEEALSDLKDLAENGNFDAAYMLGMIYRNGAYNQNKNLTLAVEFYKIAAQTDPKGEAALSLGVIFLKGEKPIEPDYKEGMKYLEKAGKKGNAQALYNLGVIYRDGKYNQKQDLKKAKEYFSESYVKGNNEAGEAARAIDKIINPVGSN